MPENQHIVSVIIPCYNHGHFIEEAIESVEQYPDKAEYEIIIVNDGSTDDFTNKLLIKKKNEGYNVVFQKNQGLSAARNNAIKLAKGKYILPLDADNRIMPEYISKSIEIMENSEEIDIVYGDALYFGEKSGRWIVGEFDKERLLQANYIDACAVYRKTAWEKCKGYKEDMPYGWEDWEFWLNLIEHNYRFHYIPEIMFYYRVSGNSMVTHIQKSAYKRKMLNTYVFYKHIDLYDEYSDPISAHKEKQQMINYYEQQIAELHYECANKIILLKKTFSYRIGNFIIRQFSLFKNLCKKK